MQQERATSDAEHEAILELVELYGRVLGDRMHYDTTTRVLTYYSGEGEVCTPSKSRPRPEVSSSTPCTPSPTQSDDSCSSPRSSKAHRALVDKQQLAWLEGTADPPAGLTGKSLRNWKYNAKRKFPHNEHATRSRARRRAPAQPVLLEEQFVTYVQELHVSKPSHVPAHLLKKMCKAIYVVSTQGREHVIATVVANCNTCGIPSVPHQTTLRPLAASAPLELLLLDYGTWDFGILEGVHYTSFLVAVDHFSKFLWVVLTPNQSSDHVLWLLTQIANQFGVYLIYLTDNGSHFVNDAVKQHIKGLQEAKGFSFNFRHGEVYHPQTQGMAEHAVKTTKELLFQVPVQLRKSADLVAAVAGLVARENERPRPTTKCAPRILMRQLRDTGLEDVSQDALNKMYSAYCREALMAQCKSRAKMVRRAARKHPLRFCEVGDLVYVRDRKRFDWHGETIRVLTGQRIIVRWGESGGPHTGDAPGTTSAPIHLKYVARGKAASSTPRDVQRRKNWEVQSRVLSEYGQTLEFTDEGLFDYGELSDRLGTVVAAVEAERLCPLLIADQIIDPTLVYNFVSQVHQPMPFKPSLPRRTANSTGSQGGAQTTADTTVVTDVEADVEDDSDSDSNTESVCASVAGQKFQEGMAPVCRVDDEELAIALEHRVDSVYCRDTAPDDITKVYTYFVNWLPTEAQWEPVFVDGELNPLFVPLFTVDDLLGLSPRKEPCAGRDPSKRKNQFSHWQMNMQLGRSLPVWHRNSCYADCVCAVLSVVMKVHPVVHDTSSQSTKNVDLMLAAWKACGDGTSDDHAANTRRATIDVVKSSTSVRLGEYECVHEFWESDIAPHEPWKSMATWSGSYGDGRRFVRAVPSLSAVSRPHRFVSKPVLSCPELRNHPMPKLLWISTNCPKVPEIRNARAKLWDGTIGSHAIQIIAVIIAEPSHFTVYVQRPRDGEFVDEWEYYDDRHTTGHAVLISANTVRSQLLLRHVYGVVCWRPE